MSVSFLTPVAALAALAVLLPLAAGLLAERRFGRLRRLLELGEPGRRRRLPAVLAAVVLFGLLGAAAAEPVALLERESLARRDAEAFFVFDVSRSMLATRFRGEPTRFQRAVQVALELRPRLGDVPVGVASLTDRPLPHIFPTADRQTFSAVVERVIGIERPPPAEAGRTLATDFGSLKGLANANFFSASSAKRLVVLLSDGESLPFDEDELVEELENEGVAMVVVRFWSAGERVFDRRGALEPYRPDPASTAVLERLAARTRGGRVFSEDEIEPVAAAARSYLGQGPATAVAVEDRVVPLGGYVALAAALPLAFLLVRRTR